MIKINKALNNVFLLGLLDVIKISGFNRISTFLRYLSMSTYLHSLHFDEFFESLDDEEVLVLVVPGHVAGMDPTVNKSSTNKGTFFTDTLVIQCLKLQ